MVSSKSPGSIVRSQSSQGRPGGSSVQPRCGPDSPAANPRTQCARICREASVDQPILVAQRVCAAVAQSPGSPRASAESIGSALLGLVDEAGDAAVGDDPYDGHGDIAGQGYHHAGAAQCQCGDDADQVQEGRGLALDVGAQYARLDEDHATVVVDRTSSWPARSGTR